MTLCQALTQSQMSIRVLGLSKMAETPTSAAFYATGTISSFVGDVTRRVLMCSIDPMCERPELRSFEGNLIADVKKRRGELVAAGLTVLAAWHAAGECVDGLTPTGTTPGSLGSFETWSHRVRSPLVWLGRPDPVEKISETRDADPRLAELQAILTLWRDHIGLGRYAPKIINEAASSPALFDALKTVARDRTGNSVDPLRLGIWLGKVKGVSFPNYGLPRPAYGKEGKL